MQSLISDNTKQWTSVLHTANWIWIVSLKNPQAEEKRKKKGVLQSMTVETQCLLCQWYVHIYINQFSNVKNEFVVSLDQFERKKGRVHEGSMRVWGNGE